MWSSPPGNIEYLIEELRRDNVNGASALALKACRIVQEFLDAYSTPDVNFPQQLSRLCTTLTQAQPMMAPILNLCTRILGQVKLNDQPFQVHQRARETVVSFARHMGRSIHQLNLHALELFNNHSRFLTHSHSSAVKGAFFHANDSGRHFSVYCTESRPKCEGTQLALELAHHGITVNLIADASVFAILSDIDCVVVGADSVSSRGIVNKIGTRGIALAARSAGIPLYALCGSEKFLPAQLVSEESKRDPRELFQESAPNLEVRNMYYDITPLEYASGIITEDGVMLISQLDERLTRIEKDYTDHRPGE